MTIFAMFATVVFALICGFLCFSYLEWGDGYKQGFWLWQVLFGCRGCGLHLGWHKMGCKNNGFPRINPFG